VYTAQGTIEKSHLLKQHQPMVRRMALQMLAKLPASVELDERVEDPPVRLREEVLAQGHRLGQSVERIAAGEKRAT
jgi:RNA polymerase sigma factor for flagellar operon FliA